MFKQLFYGRYYTVTLQSNILASTDGVQKILTEAGKDLTIKSESMEIVNLELLSYIFIVKQSETRMI